MKHFLTTLFTIIFCSTYGQNAIDWDGKYQLQLSDFKSPTTQIGNTNIYSLYTGSCFEFGFSMSRAEFMFTKNFNSNVNCSFKRQAASLIAPDSVIADALIQLARYQFDLSELYARKFRKQFFEKKGTFSNVDFFKPIYDSIQTELTSRSATAGQTTDAGKNKEKLGQLHLEVLIEIEEYSEYCKACTPPGKQK